MNQQTSIIATSFKRHSGLLTYVHFGGCQTRSVIAVLVIGDLILVAVTAAHASQAVEHLHKIPIKQPGLCILVTLLKKSETRNSNGLKQTDMEKRGQRKERMYGSGLLLHQLPHQRHGLCIIEQINNLSNPDLKLKSNQVDNSS